MLLFIEQKISSAPLTNLPAMDAEATQLLERLKTEVDVYASQFKSGEVEFTITIHAVTQSPIPFGTKPNYEEQGHWQITYKFDEEHQFYDVKARKKMELGSRFPLPEWTDIHHQYLVKEKTLYVWEKIGSEWKQHPPRKMPSTFLEDGFNPQWWNLPPEGLKRFFRRYKTVDIKNVEIHGIPHLKLSLYRPGKDRLDSNTTYEIWIDPQKDYHATRTIAYERGIHETFTLNPDGTRNFERRPFLGRTHTTYQLARYEPGIWFPKTVTQQWTGTPDISEVFPDIPVTEVPLIMNEALIPEATLVKRLQPYGTYRIQVQRAIFNIPIEQKDLPITLEK
ncbi:MAG: hypothetical protein OXH39_08775 [Candidatus Poribacteria bacterium]|nr:hypothetical protein [Candidatus Poribacteria bacterium]